MNYFNVFINNLKKDDKDMLLSIINIAENKPELIINIKDEIKKNKNILKNTMLPNTYYLNYDFFCVYIVIKERKEKKLIVKFAFNFENTRKNIFSISKTFEEQTTSTTIKFSSEKTTENESQYFNEFYRTYNLEDNEYGDCDLGDLEETDYNYNSPLFKENFFCEILFNIKNIDDTCELILIEKDINLKKDLAFQFYLETMRKFIVDMKV